MYASAKPDSVKQVLRFDETDEVLEFSAHDSPSKINKHLSNGRITKYEVATSATFWISFSLFSAILICLLLTFVPPHIWKMVGITISEKQGNLYLSWQEQQLIYISGFLFCIGTSLLLAAGCGWFSWNVIYQDSLQPGKNPPSPTSPSKYREKSGHTFHINYSLCIVNSICVFVYVLYWMRDHYL